jgi:hypothetical protein
MVYARVTYSTILNILLLFTVIAVTVIVVIIIVVVIVVLLSVWTWIASIVSVWEYGDWNLKLLGVMVLTNGTV